MEHALHRLVEILLEFLFGKKLVNDLGWFALCLIIVLLTPIVAAGLVGLVCLAFQRCAACQRETLR